jgi:hypothetical protein
MAVVMGVFPTLFLKPMEVSVEALVSRMQATQTLRVETPADRRPEIDRRLATVTEQAARQ